MEVILHEPCTHFCTLSSQSVPSSGHELHKKTAKCNLSTKVLTPYKLHYTLPYDFPFPGCKIKVGRSRETGRSGSTLR